MLQRLNTQPWNVLSELPKDEVRLVLPISSLEQHGPHLPVGTDDLILQAVMKQVLHNEALVYNYWLLPTQRYGLSAEHIAFPGSFTLSPATLLEFMDDIARSMTGYGWRKLTIFNSHGGNTSFLHGIGQTLGRRFGLEVTHVDLFGSALFDGAQEMLDTPVSLDIHAGEIETSILMYAMPQWVNEQALAETPDVLSGLPKYQSSWLSENITPSGLIGAASRATPEKGKKLLEFTANAVIRALNEIAMG